MIIPTDLHFSEGLKPPTRWNISMTSPNKLRLVSPWRPPWIPFWDTPIWAIRKYPVVASWLVIIMGGILLGFLGIINSRETYQPTEPSFAASSLSGRCGCNNPCTWRAQISADDVAESAISEKSAMGSANNSHQSSIDHLSSIINRH